MLGFLVIIIGIFRNFTLFITKLLTIHHAALTITRDC